MTAPKEKKPSELHYIRLALAGVRQLSAETGLPFFRLALSYAVRRVFHGAIFEEFRANRLYEYSTLWMSDYLTVGRMARCSRSLNAAASPEDLAVLDDKHIFNRVMCDFVRRDWIYMPDASPTDIRAFLRRNSKILVKANFSTQGKNIFQYDAQSVDAEAFIREYEGKDYLLEAFVTQHPAMAALNPSTVNTVRVVTFQKGGRTALMGGCLRVGGADAYVDNFHQGGVAYPLDMQTGIVTGPGHRLTAEEDFLCHPSTGCVMPGFQVPGWEQVTELAKKAALLAPHVGCVGWDVAITPDGPELIEGNINYPDPVVMQLGGKGVYSQVREFMEGT